MSRTMDINEFASEILGWDMHDDLTDEQIDYIYDMYEDYLSNRKAV